MSIHIEGKRMMKKLTCKERDIGRTRARTSGRTPVLVKCFLLVASRRREPQHRARRQGTPHEEGAKVLRQAAIMQPPAPLQHVQHRIYS
jgi:hypothetical protein